MHMLFRCKSAGNPLYVHCFVWLMVFVLYNLDITGYTYYKLDRVLMIVAGIIIPFFSGYGVVMFLLDETKPVHNICFDIRDVFSSVVRIDAVFKVFLILLVFEFVFEGYIPLISMLRGADIQHFDFGISSLHGFVMALGAILGTSYYLLYSFTKEKKNLIKILFIFSVFALLVTRKMIVVLAVQMLMIELLLFGMRNIYKYLIWILLIIIVFGMIGDVRLDRDTILSFASLNYKYPDYLPSGFIWIYLYMVTPLANLLNLVYETNVHYAWVPNFLMQLFPTVIRVHLLGENLEKGGNFSQEWLVSDAFNVSTGFSGIYTDFAIYGVILFCFVLGVFSGRLWKTKYGVQGFMSCVVLNYCISSMVFSNDFVNLNVIFQLVLIRFLFVKKY